MVSKEDILLVLNDAIYPISVKCSNNSIPSSNSSFGVRFNKKVRKALDTFRDETCGDKPLTKERINVINNEGEVVYKKNGKSTSVPYNHDKVLKQRESQGILHMTHNHPLLKNEDKPHDIIPTMLSEADARQLLWTVHLGENKGRFGVENSFDFVYKSVTAESPNGSRITLMANNKFTHENEEDYINTYHKLEWAWQNYCQSFKDKKQELISYYNTDISAGGWFSRKYHLEGKSEDECINIINHAVQDEIGTFEESVKDIRSDFNKCNVELSIEWQK